jgi:hypothetical protein
LVRVQLAVGNVGNGEVLDHLSAFELEVPHLVQLVRRIVGTGPGRSRNNEHGKSGGERPLQAV